MKTARGVNAFIRYWGPQNGGINESSKDEYSALLKVFLAADSLRWFADTYLTVPNIVLLLGEESSELKKLKSCQSQRLCARQQPLSTSGVDQKDGVLEGGNTSRHRVKNYDGKHVHGTYACARRRTDPNASEIEAQG